MEVPGWFTTLMLQLMAKPNWAELGDDTIHHMGWLAHRRVSHDQSLLGSAISVPYLSLLGFVNLPWHERAMEVTLGRGNLRLVAHGHEPALNEANAKLHPQALEGDAPGVFGVIQLVLRYSKSPNRVTYAKMLRAVSEAGESLLIAARHALKVPSPVLKPGETLATVANGIESGTDDQFAEMLQSGRLRTAPEMSSVIDYGFENSSPINAEDILECYNLSPTTALELIVLFTSPHFRRVKLAKPETMAEVVALLLPRLRSDSTPLLVVPWCWHLLIAHAGPAQAEVRDLIFSACRATLPYRGRERHSQLFHRFGNLAILVELFRLFAQHKEASILPHFTDLMLSQLRMFGEIDRHPHGSRTALPPELTGEILGAQQYLKDLLADQRQCWSVRCSAALVLMFHAGDDPPPVVTVCQLFVTHCNSRAGEWLLNALVIAISVIARKQTPALTGLLRDLFDACREDFCARSILEQVLMVWREASTAPVTTHNVRDKWLYRE